jgi:hypothetical protein
MAGPQLQGSRLPRPFGARKTQAQAQAPDTTRPPEDRGQQPHKDELHYRPVSINHATVWACLSGDRTHGTAAYLQQPCRAHPKVYLPGAAVLLKTAA